MKKYLLLITTLLFSSFIFSQTRGITYQAVLYNPESNNISLPGFPSQPVPFVNKDVCLRFDITDINSNVTYSETHTTTTDQFGMVNLIIGKGNKVGGSVASFGSIDWNTQANSLVVLLDGSANCSNFVQVSNQPFTATPFSLASGSSLTIVDASTTQKGQIQLAGDLGGTAAAPIVPGLALKADITDLNSGLATKANSTDVTTALALKADITDLNSGLATKANSTDVTTALALKADITALDSGLAAKANSTDVTTALALKADITALNSGLAAKANSTDVTTALALKADITALNSGLATKANSTDVTTALALKADITALNSGLATKANSTDLTTALALKADITALNSGLATKANSTDLTTALALKADITALNSGLAIKANTTDVTSALALKAPLASPSLTGIPTAPTATSGTNTTQLATTEFVTSAVQNYVDISSSQTIAGSKSFTDNIRVGTTTPNASAALEVASTTQGFLMPRMSTVQMNSIVSPALGLMVYNTTTNSLNIYTGSSWNSITSIAPPPPAPTYPAGTVHCNPNNITAIVEVTSPTGRIWMDRNLGASRVPTSRNDLQGVGSLYQWGRFSDGHQCKISSSSTTTLSSGDQPLDSRFILTNNASSQHEGDWRTTPNLNLWQGVNGINNPCPSGFRIPTKAEFEAETQTWSGISESDGFNSILKLSPGGTWNPIANQINSVGTNGFYWTSTVDSTSNNEYSYMLSLSDGGFYGDYRTFGFSVRCIKD